MKRLLILLLLLVLILPASATTVASVYHAPSKTQAPYAEVMVLEQSPFEEGTPLLQIDFINIKVGDAILLRCGGQSMLIDGGSRGRAAMLTNFMKEQGITGFTYYFNSHAHDDHIEASTRLVQLGYPAQEYLSKYPREATMPELLTLFSALDQKGIPYRQVQPGDTLDLGGAQLTFIQNTRPQKGQNVNALSMMIHISYGARTMLLPADVTGSSLMQVMEDSKEYMQVDIMKSPHHGINRLPQGFLEFTNPELFIITSDRETGKELSNQLKVKSYPHYFIYTGTVHLETDGNTWYVEQIRK